jgi:hypothetical protein
MERFLTFEIAANYNRRGWLKSKWRANSEVVFESEPAGDEIRKAISPYQVVKGVE